MATFAELFCEHYRIPPERFVSAVFFRCLHRRTWVFVPLLRLAAADYFAADHQLIRDAGRLTRASALADELADFNAHPDNINFARRRLKLRVSAHRLARLVRRMLPEPHAAEALDSNASARVS